MGKYSAYLAFFILVVMLAACNLEKEIDIELPNYESKIFVECYLEPGQPFTLLMTRTSPYFAPFPPLDAQFLDQLLVDSAEVSIRHKGVTYILRNQLLLVNRTRKLYNYKSDELVPFSYDDDFELFISTKEGTTITAITKILKPVPLDSIVVNFAENDTLARVLTYFTDIPNQSNFYRRMLHQHSLDSIPEQDFATDDRFVEDVIVFGSGYRYTEGDTVFNTLFHIDKAYYDFFNSVQNANASNGNPFGQPSPIISNLGGTAGALGIFTGLSYERVRTIISR
jgi:hypothetical protein